MLRQTGVSFAWVSFKEQACNSLAASNESALSIEHVLEERFGGLFGDDAISCRRSGFKPSTTVR